VNVAMNNCAPLNAGNFLVSWGTARFSGKFLLHRGGCYNRIHWTLELRPAWHTNNLGYDQNFSLDLRPNLELRPAWHS
jgi:hypothetical protein